MSIAEKILEAQQRSSWIRKMFEQGARLKEERGPENVFDFSLGNPSLDPPPAYLDGLRQELSQPPKGKYAYMPNTGYPDTREAVAAQLRATRETPLQGRHVLMTCGAAGALNVVLKTILDPDDEVIILAPFFPEYLFYVDNHGGKTRIAETRPDFSLDTETIRESIGPRTKAVIINSPNNPTGKMYNSESLVQMGRILEKCGQQFNRTIYLISDAPYEEIVFDDKKAPDLFSCYKNTILVNSYSKSLSIPGERLGYIAVHPDIQDLEPILDGFTFCNRILGFVNAPATPQRIISRLPAISGQGKAYQRLRDLLCRGLREIGYQFVMPDGAFYLFPQSPVPDDVSFVNDLLQEGVLVVPGSGFGRSGHFRIAFCVEERVIEHALPAFARAYHQARLHGE